MNDEQKSEILQSAKEWFKESVATNHNRNTKKLADPKSFKINPFLVNYLANFLTGDDSPESIAKALIYPRMLGTSITTTFGSAIQRFTSDVLGAFGSMISGIDVEFVDQIDGRKKYCQLKSGPNTINKDDVETIAGHFTSAKNLARTNNLQIGYDDLIVGVIYGLPDQLNGHYRRLEAQYSYPVIVGKELWHRLTGDEQFYSDLIDSIGSVAIDIDASETIQQVIESLACSQEIQDLSL